VRWKKDRGRRAEGSGQLEARPPIMLGGSFVEMGGSAVKASAKTIIILKS